MNDPTPGALGGIRVVDTTTMISGPICTRILADAEHAALRERAVVA